MPLYDITLNFQQALNDMKTPNWSCLFLPCWRECPAERAMVCPGDMRRAVRCGEGEVVEEYHAQCATYMWLMDRVENQCQRSLEWLIPVSIAGKLPKDTGKERKPQECSSPETSHRLQLWHFERSWREGSAVVEKQHLTVVWVVYLVDKNWFGKRVHLVWLSLLNQAAAIYFVITLHPYPLYMVKRNCPAYINVKQFFT